MNSKNNGSPRKKSHGDSSSKKHSANNLLRNARDKGPTTMEEHYQKYKTFFDLRIDKRMECLDKAKDLTTLNYRNTGYSRLDPELSKYHAAVKSGKGGADELLPSRNCLYVANPEQRGGVVVIPLFGAIDDFKAPPKKQLSHNEKMYMAYRDFFDLDTENREICLESGPRDMECRNYRNTGHVVDDDIMASYSEWDHASDLPQRSYMNVIHPISNKCIDVPIYGQVDEPEDPPSKEALLKQRKRGAAVSNKTSSRKSKNKLSLDNKKEVAEEVARKKSKNSKAGDDKKY